MFSCDPDVQKDVTWDNIQMAQLRIQRSVVERTVFELVSDDLHVHPVQFGLGRPVSPEKAPPPVT